MGRVLEGSCFLTSASGNKPSCSAWVYSSAHLRGCGSTEITAAAPGAELSHMASVKRNETKNSAYKICFAQTYLAVLEQISKEMFGLGFLPLVFGIEKQVCSIFGKGGWKESQKNRKKDTISQKKKLPSISL